ncbi:hypothetical protein ACIBG6_38625 [Streptomyces sp. NPDC050842]|uniref:hypothetical protein n=1 Tax=Streptomyces sp. NPDC050842 TaxID=3365636 RepID=UPI0037ABE98D
MNRDEKFPAALDAWMPDDWQEYRDRVADGEPTTTAMDTISRRREREARRETGMEVTR